MKEIELNAEIDIDLSAIIDAFNKANVAVVEAESKSSTKVDVK